MYVFLLALHSLVRWFVLAVLLFSIFRAYRGWLLQKRFSLPDHAARKWASAIAGVQLILGVTLYLVSPVVGYFLHHYTEAVRQREIRFFGMEHSLMMLTGLTVIIAGAAKAKRAATDQQQFRIMAIWFTIALLIIISSIPWGFSPVVSRPYFRPF